MQTQFAYANTHMKHKRIDPCRWYKHYVWSPWDVDLMEDCHVLSFNLALHYFADVKMSGNNPLLLANSKRSTITRIQGGTATHMWTTPGLSCRSSPTGAAACAAAWPFGR